MNITEEDVRALVREAIDRHLRPRSAPRPLLPVRDVPGSHPSHVMLRVLPGSDVGEGACVIEPAVGCSHCGFCRSYGH